MQEIPKFEDYHTTEEIQKLVWLRDCASWKGTKRHWPWYAISKEFKCSIKVVKGAYDKFTK